MSYNFPNQYNYSFPTGVICTQVIEPVVQTIKIYKEEDADFLLAIKNSLIKSLLIIDNARNKARLNYPKLFN